MDVNGFSPLSVKLITYPDGVLTCVGGKKGPSPIESPAKRRRFIISGGKKTAGGCRCFSFSNAVSIASFRFFFELLKFMPPYARSFVCESSEGIQQTLLFGRDMPTCWRVYKDECLNASSTQTSISSLSPNGLKLTQPGNSIPSSKNAP